MGGPGRDGLAGGAPSVDGRPDASVEASPPAVPVLVAGRYRPVRFLGRGGMGVVHEAEDTRLDRRVAVKMLTAVEGLAGDSEAWDRFRREARALARIDHPGVVTLYDSGVHDGTPYLVMQVLDGTTLAGLVSAAGRLPTAVVCTVAFGMAEALEAAHAAGVLHRDVKPTNVGITRSGRVVLQDFGLARLAGEAAITRTGALVGTPQFMAPEAMRGVLPERAADWYGLGVCMYLMITGELPFGPTVDFGAIMERALGEGVPPLTGSRWDCPEDLCRLVDDLCRQDPALRRQDAETVRDVLLPLTYGGTEALAGLATGRAREDAVRDARAVQRFPETADPDEEVPEYLWDEAAVLPSPRDAPQDPFRPVTLSDTTRRIVLGSMTPQSALSRQREAVNLVQRGRLQEAAQMLAVVVPVCLSTLGPDHPTTLTGQYWHAVCLARLDAGRDAIELFSRVNRRLARRTDGHDD
ncbi:serine/threonine protein kinase [Streptomyces phaeoluteigriseus]|uniref:non-specific serine/threonine protein kinase n=1 Tax=Streptomyces phaeoluteigriseus TaxID=114686 RepID=A0ABY4ZEB5_9ACTN|nr:serine/threonine-protein kinase [Streptomyces phaeoluteigriseus]USQ87227.1 serine/threonine protein kinase [Streptomyces phaeoluteigriseus]